MISFLKPKNTLLSVAQELKAGMDKENIYLNDHELNEAGYEAHEVFNILNSIVALQVKFAITLATMSASFFVLGYLLPYIGINHPLIDWFSTTKVQLVTIVCMVFIYVLIGLSFKIHKKRYITKKSNRG